MKEAFDALAVLAIESACSSLSLPFWTSARPSPEIAETPGFVFVVTAAID